MSKIDKIVPGKIKIVAIAFACIFALSFFFASQSNAAQYISESAAKSIVLNHAGVTEAEVKIVKFVQYEKRGLEIYDIKFLSAREVFRYEVNARTGDIVSYFAKTRH